MEFGLFTEFQCPAGMSEATAFDESMAQMHAAEALGFDAVWLGEIHFQKDRSVLASPLVVASAIAASTRRVKIGIAVQVLPLSHPLHLAEDVATVDHLSRGRLDFGVGRSGLPGHYTGFNIPYEESRDRFFETLEIMQKAWTLERFTHEGRHFQFRDVCVLPKPYQKALADAVAEGIAWQNQELRAREKTLLDKFKQAGMEVILPDHESFRKPVLDTVPKLFEAKWGAGLYQRIVDTK